MKILWSVLWLIFSASAYSQEGIIFFEGSFEEAKQEAAKQNKLIFMDAYTVWCGPCKRMAADVFPQKEVGDFFNKNFINMKVDMEKGEGRDIAKQYSIYSYPTLLFIDESGQVVTLAKGMRNAEGLIDLGKKALLPNPVMVAKLEAQYVAGEKGISFLKDYIKVKATLGDDYTEPFADLIRQLTTADRIEPANAEFIFTHTNQLNSPGLEVMAEFEQYYKDLFKENYDAKIIKIAENEVLEAIKNIDEEQLKQAISFLKKHKPKAFEEQAAYFEVAFYSQTKKWMPYDKAATNYIKKFKANDEKVLREVAWNYYLFIEDFALLKKAEKWAEKSVKLENSYQNNLAHAYLLYKLNKNTQALTTVETAITLAENNAKLKENATLLKKQIESRLAEGKK
jgi:thiol-disulfide isomerase/thioredoxin